MFLEFQRPLRSRPWWGWDVLQSEECRVSCKEMMMTTRKKKARDFWTPTRQGPQLSGTHPSGFHLSVPHFSGFKHPAFGALPPSGPRRRHAGQPSAGPPLRPTPRAGCWVLLVGHANGSIILPPTQHKSPFSPNSFILLLDYVRMTAITSQKLLGQDRNVFKHAVPCARTMAPLLSQLS